MTRTSLPQPHEQRKVEELLVKLSKVKPTLLNQRRLSRECLQFGQRAQQTRGCFSRHSESMDPTVPTA